MRPGNGEYTSCGGDAECGSRPRARAAERTSARPAQDRALAVSAHGQRSPRLPRYATAPDATTSAVAPAHAYEQCRLITRNIARTFYYGSRFLPLEKRRASWALYAFCRTADDIADASGPFPDAFAELAGWRRALLDTYAGRPRGPVMSAWADALARFAVPIEPALELLAGVASDVVGARYATFDELLRYCYRVAGTVGLLMAPILGYEDEDALPCAVDLGIAMQLTNILRDIGEDAARGRIYLPAEDLARFGYSQAELRAGTLTPAFADLMAFQIARANSYYQRGLRGVPLLSPDARLAIALSGALYQGILQRISRNHYDVFGARAHISLPGKLSILPRVWLQTRLVIRIPRRSLTFPLQPTP